MQTELGFFWLPGSGESVCLKFYHALELCDRQWEVHTETMWKSISLTTWGKGRGKKFQIWRLLAESALVSLFQIYFGNWWLHFRNTETSNLEQEALGITGIPQMSNRLGSPDSKWPPERGEWGLFEPMFYSLKHLGFLWNTLSKRPARVMTRAALSPPSQVGWRLSKLSWSLNTVRRISTSGLAAKSTRKSNRPLN